MKPHISNYSDLANYSDQTAKQLGLVLSCHLNLEGLLSVMIEQAVPNPKVLNLDRMTFAHKANLCRALDLISHQEYSVLKKMNQIRNRAAHRLGYRPSFEEVHAIVVEAGRAGIDFSDCVDGCNAVEAKEELGYDTNSLLIKLFENAFFWIAANNDDIWYNLTT